MTYPFPPVLLLVEDDADDAWLLRRALDALPLRIAADTAPTVPDAIAYLRRSLEDPSRRAPSVILTDVNLPGRPGWDLLEWLAERHGLGAVPRLVWTSLPNPEGERRARLLRARLYVAKPRDYEGYRRMAALVAESLGD